MQKVMFEKIQRTLRAVALVDQNYHHRRVMLLNKWWQWDLQKVKIQRSLRAVALVSRSKLSSSPSHAVSYLWTNLIISIQSPSLLVRTHIWQTSRFCCSHAESDVWEDSKDSSCGSIGRSKLSSSPSHCCWTSGGNEICRKWCLRRFEVVFVR